MSYFKIDSNEVFTEWKKMTNIWEKLDFQAKILPDRNYIQDMLSDFELYWDKISETDYNSFLASIKD
ncbi:MAG: hypothetical protein JKY48_08255 [Flavobacteriales bacterium]|nr:hypothetical protein [Flavobacteriales bacterium]